MRTSLYYLYQDLVVFGRAAAFLAAAAVIIATVLALFINALVVLRPLPTPAAAPRRPSVARTKSLSAFSAAESAAAVPPLALPLPLAAAVVSPGPVPRPTSDIIEAAHPLASATLILAASNGPPLLRAGPPALVQVWAAAAAIIVPIILAAFPRSQKPSTTGGVMSH